MIVVSNRLQVAKGQEQEFEKRFEGRARLVENMPVSSASRSCGH